MKKVLIVGMNPSGAKKMRKGNTLNRLWEWTDSLQIGTFSFTNVSFDRGNGIKITPDYEYINKVCKSHNKVLALGNIASDTLKKLEIDHFKLPHPSPLNRQINDQQFIDNVLEECKKYID